MSKNRGLGAILTDNNTMLEFQPNMVDLGTQYIKNSNNYWPNTGKTIGLVVGNSPSTLDGVRIYGKTKNGLQFLNTNLSSMSVGGTPTVATSDDGNYLAVGGNSSSATTLELYKRTGSTFIKLSGPATMPTGSCTGLAISPDGTYITYTQTASPYFYIFKRTGDTFTNLSNPSTMPTGAGRCCAFSFDGNYLAVGHSVTPFMTVYSRSGDTFTKLSDPATLPSSTLVSMLTWCGNGYIAIGTSGTPSVPEVYKLSAGALTKLSNPATPSVGTLAAMAGSSDSVYLSVVGGTSPFVAVYKINTSTDTFTKLTLSGITIGSLTGTSIAISKDVKYMCVGYGTNVPYAQLYSIGAGDTFTKVAEQFSADGLTGAVQTVAFINSP